jgi:serine/threonine-protein kinase
MIGEIVGTYRLLQKLGEGSMGEVFLGQHTQSGEQAAVKVLFPPFSKQGMALTRYFTEVRSTNALAHAGIATISTAEPTQAVAHFCAWNSWQGVPWQRHSSICRLAILQR